MVCRVEVLEYNQSADYSVCRMADGTVARIDLVVDGSLGDTLPRELIGKTVEFERMDGFIFIAHKVRVLTEAA